MYDPWANGSSPEPQLFFALVTFLPRLLIGPSLQICRAYRPWRPRLWRSGAAVLHRVETFDRDGAKWTARRQERRFWRNGNRVSVPPRCLRRLARRHEPGQEQRHHPPPIAPYRHCQTLAVRVRGVNGDGGAFRRRRHLAFWRILGGGRRQRRIPIKSCWLRSRRPC